MYVCIYIYTHPIGPRKSLCNVNPSALNPKPDKGPQRGSKGKERGHRSNNRNSTVSGNVESEQSEIIQLLSKLFLRHEAQINQMKVDTSFHLYLTPGCSATLPLLFTHAAKWKQLKESEPATLTMSLRETLFRSLIAELKSRLTVVDSNPESQKYAKAQGWLSAQEA